MVTMLLLILLPVAFLLPPGAGAGKIIRGREATPHSRPYMAYLDIQRGNENINCGGFLVSDKFVLTAAHCRGEKIVVYVGAHDISQPENTQQRIPVLLQIPHEEYDEQTKNNDIMLLVLAQNVAPTNWVGPIPVANPHDSVPPGYNCSIAGWGCLVPDGALLPDTLREVDVVVMPDAACPNNPHWLYRHYNSSTMMCVGDPARFYNAGKGDSGGPLVCGGTAQGIISWGTATAPAVYTKISAFIPWLTDKVHNLPPITHL